MVHPWSAVGNGSLYIGNFYVVVLGHSSNNLSIVLKQPRDKNKSLCKRTGNKKVNARCASLEISYKNFVCVAASFKL